MNGALKSSSTLSRAFCGSPESILFPSGAAELNEEGRNALSILASVLAETIPCYAADAPPYCPEDLRGEIETIFIEGHTDNVPINTPRYPDNWTLSTARAIRTYQVLTEESPSLDRYRNRYGRPLFTVSGYADRRPVASNDTEDGRRLNRRIDLRFVMVSPQTPEIVRTIQERLYGSESGLPRISLQQHRHPSGEIAMPGAVRADLARLERDTLKRIEGASLPPVSGLLLQREEEIRAKFGDAVNRKPPERDLEEMWLQVASHWRQRRSLRGLPRRTIRSMPYLLYFLPRNGYRFLDVPALVSEYLSLLQQRPSSRVIRTMIRLFLQEYPREARSFDLLRRNLRSLVAESQNSLLEEWRRRANLYGLFDRTPVQLASVLRTSENPEAVVRDTGMNDEWNNWAILREAWAMLWEEAESRIKAYGGLPHDIELLLRSSVRNRRLRIITEKERIALALVRPFQLQPPPMDVRKRIVDFFSVECSYDYGDPRIHRANWMTVDRSVVESLKQWMVEETLEDFFRLIRPNV